MFEVLLLLLVVYDNNLGVVDVKLLQLLSIALRRRGPVTWTGATKVVVLIDAVRVLY